LAIDPEGVKMELTVTRRTFLKTTVLGLTGLTLGCRIGPWPPDGISSNLTVWINISEDNQVTIMVSKAEMGQGVSTALPMIVAEELEADWTKVQFELRGEVGDYAIGGGFGMTGITGGSTSVSTLFEPLREVGAAAREMLISSCAQRWQVNPKILTAKNSFITHPTRGSISYGELVEEASLLPIPAQPQLKDPAAFTLIGKPLHRLDSPDHIEGRSVFGTDVKVPEMLYAAVRQSPVFGGEITNFNSLSVEGTSAEAIVEIPGGVAVVARSWWEAEKVAQSLDLDFHIPEDMEGLDSDDISQQLTQDLSKAGSQVRLVGSPVVAFETAPVQIESLYEVPFLAHATMEPMTCTAKVTPESCEVWVPTQSARIVEAVTKANTGLDTGLIKVNPTYLGGGFGRKVESDYVAQAVLASKAVGKPVKVIWSREEDIQHDYYRPVFKAELKGGIDNNKKITSWIGKSVGPSLMGGRFDFTATAGFSPLPYDVPNMSAHYVQSNVGVPIGWWRSIGSSQNGFFVESFVDELADAAGEDPLEFRRGQIKDITRSLEVLERVAAMANWGQPGVPGAAQGVAFVPHGATKLAQIAEVSVDSGGEITVHKVYCAIDCGDVVNPDIVRAQVEGAIIFGLTAALFGKITIEDGCVQQSNFHDYPLLTMKDAPPIETEIIISGARRSGVGEGGVPPIAPAVTNAIFAATGNRIRKLPIHHFRNRFIDNFN
jgi:isoquinoline 1-oxidoreductase beta subunit